MLNPVTVQSSNINAVAYDLENEELYVRFQSTFLGDWYCYADVSPELAWEFVMAESRGKFLNAEIKPTHSVAKLTEEEARQTFQA